MIDIKNIEGDDAGFIMMTASIVTGIRKQIQPRSIRPIRIDNWFGEKWYRFSGKVMGAFGISKHQLTVPPFVPSRVAEESYWVRTGRDDYQRNDEFTPLHQAFSSEENMRRYFNIVCPDSAVIWYSSNTRSNGRGAVMVYISSPGYDDTAWYVELIAKTKWMPSINNGFTRDEFIKLINSNRTKAEQGDSA